MAAPSVTLSAPYTIFPLSQPLIHQTRNNPTGEGHVRPCYTASVEIPSSKKRKRVSSEIAVAVDGEGINIYDVSNTQTVASYATPVSTRFSCAPASVRTGSSIRTYAAVSHPKKQILCWTQKDAQSDDDAAEEASTFTRANDSKADVVLLKDLTAPAKKSQTSVPGDVISVYANSDIKCFSPDLAEERWTFSYKSVSDRRILYAVTTTSSVARKSFFKNRPDVLLRDSVEGQTAEDVILVTISVSSDNCQVDCYSIIPTSASQKGSARHILTVPLPSLSLKDSSTPSTFAIHIPSANVHCLTDSKLISYNLTALVPTITSTIALPVTEKVSATPADVRYSLFSLTTVSSTMVLVSTPDSLSLYETKYSSLQARVLFSSDVAAGSTPNGTDPLIEHSLHLTLYLSDLDLVVGYSHEGIIAVQLSRAGGDVKSKASSGLLIDSICRGVTDLSVNAEEPLDTARYEQIKKEMKETRRKEKERKRHQRDKAQKGVKAVSEESTNSVVTPLILADLQQKVALQNLQEKRNAEDLYKFEHAFAEYVEVRRNKEQVKAYKEWLANRKEGDGDSKMVNGTSDGEDVNDAPELPEFMTPKSQSWKELKESGEMTAKEIREQEEDFFWRPLTQKFITTVLSMIFELSADASRLEISFFPVNVVKYLVESGSFSSSLLAIAERQQLESRSQVAPEKIIGTTAPREPGRGGLVDCLVDYDPSFTHLAWFLREAGEIDLDQIIVALKIVLSRLEDANTQAISSITAGDPADDDDEERRLQRLTYEAEIALDNASKALEDTNVLEEVLRLSVKRLYSFPSEKIVRGFRQVLARDELMNFVRILRREMVADRAGIDAEDSDDDTPTTATALEASDVELVCELLTAALDAVGVAGLILANDTVSGRRSTNGGFNIDLDGDLAAIDDVSAEDLQGGNELLITSLHNEVGAAVASVQEAATLVGLLRELFRHAGGLSAAEGRAKRAERQEARKSKIEQQKKKAVSEEEQLKASAAAVVGAATPSKLRTPARRLQTQHTVHSSAHAKYLRSRRSQRRNDGVLGRPEARKLFAKKLKKANLPMPVIRKRRAVLAEKRGVRVGNREGAMLPLAAAGPMVVGGGDVRKKRGTWGAARRELGIQGHRAVGVYSLEKLTV